MDVSGLLANLKDAEQKIPKSAIKTKVDLLGRVSTVRGELEDFAKTSDALQKRIDKWQTERTASDKAKTALDNDLKTFKAGLQSDIAHAQQLFSMASKETDPAVKKLDGTTYANINKAYNNPPKFDS